MPGSRRDWPRFHSFSQRYCLCPLRDIVQSHLLHAPHGAELRTMVLDAQGSNSLWPWRVVRAARFNLIVMATTTAVLGTCSCIAMHGADQPSTMYCMHPAAGSEAACFPRARAHACGVCSVVTVGVLKHCAIPSTPPARVHTCCSRNSGGR
jgi:hypothetical protein